MAGTPAPGAAAAEDPPRVVVVDDDHTAAAIIEAILLKDGCWIRTFHDPREALESMLREPADVLVSDWLMPGMDGPDLLKEVRKNPLIQATYCILVTAHDQAGRKVAGLLVGADDYLLKPISEMELLARIRVGMRVRRLERQAMMAVLAATLGHEINTPLTGVFGYLDLLKARIALGDATGCIEAVKQAEEATERIRCVVARLMEIQRPVTKEYRPGTRMIDLGESGGGPPPAR